MTSRYGRIWTTPTGFAATHCRNCAMGWTRTGKEGALTMCLLDREPVLSEMTEPLPEDPDERLAELKHRIAVLRAQHNAENER